MTTFAGDMPHTITIAEPSGVDAAGSPSYGAQTTAPARVQSKTSIVRGVEEDAEAEHVVYTYAAVSRAARVWLPGTNTANADEARKPLSVETMTDLAGGESITKVVL